MIAYTIICSTFVIATVTLVFLRMRNPAFWQSARPNPLRSRVPDQEGCALSAGSETNGQQQRRLLSCQMWREGANARKAVLRCCVERTATAGHERSSAMQTFARQVLQLHFSGINCCTPVALQLPSCIHSAALPFYYQQGQCSAIEVRLRCWYYASTTDL